MKSVKNNLNLMSALSLIFAAMLLLTCKSPFNGGTPDGDPPGIIVNPTGGLLTTEAGETDAFTVVLRSFCVGGTFDGLH